MTDDRMGTVEIPKLPKRVMKGFTNKEVIKMIGVYGYKSDLDACNKAIIAMLADRGAHLITFAINKSNCTCS